MKKMQQSKPLIFIFCLFLLLSANSCRSKKPNSEKEPTGSTEIGSTVLEPSTIENLSSLNISLPSSETSPTDLHNEEEMRGFWLSYSEIKSLVASNADDFYQNLYTHFFSLSQAGFNTVFFHARAFADAFYASSYFPWSAYASGTQGEAPGYDLLAVAVRAAHDCSLKIHAWINPYRVSYSTDLLSLSESNPARKMAENGEMDQLLITKSGIYFNPASEKVQNLILRGIQEIVVNYDVDGVHIDDYFYPSDVGNSDAQSYRAFTQGGGNLSLGDWRRSHVNALIRQIYTTVKADNPDMLFGISPGGIPETNYSTYYADVASWVQQTGFCDYLAPQIYFGFLNQNYSYDSLLRYWINLCANSSVKLYIGLPLYKTGEIDSYAGSKEGKREFIENSDIIKRQILRLREEKTIKGFIIFSFGDMIDDNANEIKQKEVSNLFDIL